jgi:hypothetical protein
MITSGTTSYCSNQSMLAVATDVHGPWYVAGDPCVGDTDHTTFDSQVSSVFLDPRTGRHIALADRWIVDPALKHNQHSGLIDTSVARYVWLPIQFQDGMPRISWHEEWDPSAQDPTDAHPVGGGRPHH